jgi:hypothetical protein
MEKNMSDNNIVDVEFRDVPQVPQEFTVETDETRREGRLLDLMKPINQQIEQCESRADILLMATAMMHTARDLFICEIGKEATQILFSNLKFENPLNNESQDS